MTKTIKIIGIIIVFSLASVLGEELGTMVTNFFVSGEYLNWLVVMFIIPWVSFILWMENKIENKNKTT